MRPACSREAAGPKSTHHKKMSSACKTSTNENNEDTGPQLSSGQVFVLNACDNIEYQRSSTWRPAPHTKRPELRSLARGYI